MPYIPRDRQILLQAGASAENVGELTYLLQQDLRDYLLVSDVSYERISQCIAALEGAKADLIHRVLTPYEDVKRNMNGDVWFQKGESI